jgi:hypothetical protein
MRMKAKELAEQQSQRGGRGGRGGRGRGRGAGAAAGAGAANAGGGRPEPRAREPPRAERDAHEQVHLMLRSYTRAFRPVCNVRAVIGLGGAEAA